MPAKPGSQAVTRTLRLLKLFDDKRQTLTVAEAVSTTGLNRTTAFRLLTTLEDEGFLERLPDGAWALGAELAAIGGLAMRSNHLYRTAHPELVALGAEIDERVTMEVLSYSAENHPSMLVVDEISASHRLGIREFVGNHLPIHATSTGKVVMAWLPPAELAEILALPRAQLTENTLVETEGISAELATIRKQGYSQANNELEEGFIAMAVPIFDAQKAVCAAICFVVPSVRVNEERTEWLLSKLKETGQRISHKIGYRTVK